MLALSKNAVIKSTRKASAELLYGYGDASCGKTLALPINSFQLGKESRLRLLADFHGSRVT